MGVKKKEFWWTIDYNAEDLKVFFGQDPEPTTYPGWDEIIGFIYRSVDSYGTNVLLEADICEKRLMISTNGFFLWINFDWKIERQVINLKETLVLSQNSQETGSPFLTIYKDPCFFVELSDFSLSRLNFEKKPIDIDFIQLRDLLRVGPIENTQSHVVYVAKDPKGRELELVIIPHENTCLVNIRLHKDGPVLTKAKFFDVTKIGFYQERYSGENKTFNSIGIWGDLAQDEPVSISFNQKFSLYLPDWAWEKFCG